MRIVLKRSAAPMCVSDIGRRNCGNTGGHSVRSGRAGSADTAQAESGRRAAAGTAGKPDTRASSQGTPAEGSSAGRPAGAAAAAVAGPEKQRGGTEGPGGASQAASKELDGEVQLLLRRSTGAPPRP